jgi:ankyrin repeat protein
VFFGFWDVLCALDESGASLHVADAAGFTLLHTAVQRGHNDVLLYLIRHKVDMNKGCMEDESTALHAAVKNRQSRAVLMLCEANADLNAQDRQGYTPLAFADEQCRDILLAHKTAAQAMLAEFSFESDATP